MSSAGYRSLLHCLTYVAEHGHDEELDQDMPVQFLDNRLLTHSASFLSTVQAEASPLGQQIVEHFCQWLPTAPYLRGLQSPTYSSLPDVDLVERKLSRVCSSSWNTGIFKHGWLKRRLPV